MTNTIESVWAKVERRGPNECWPWIGKSWTVDGRGRLDIGGEEGVYAPRAAYLSANPDSIQLRDDGTDQNDVLHTCDNPSCCNPAHLFVGSHTQNMQDKVSKGRSPDFRGARGPRAKLTAEDVFWIRIQKRYGATKKALAMLHEVSEATISGCLYGRHYQDVAL